MIIPKGQQKHVFCCSMDGNPTKKAKPNWCTVSAGKALGTFKVKTLVRSPIFNFCAKMT